MTNRQDVNIGKTFGEYQLQYRLGGGAFGTVYFAEHVRNHTPVALKVFKIQLSSNEDFRDFINEARIIRLHHPHIVPVLDFNLNREDIPYLVMEHIPGGTIRTRYHRGAQLDVATVASYTEQLASALYYAHQHRVIHRDVKPENILLRDNLTILLSDFGIAKVLEQSSLVSQSTQRGTPAYMAPEQSQC